MTNQHDPASTPRIDPKLIRFTVSLDRESLNAPLSIISSADAAFIEMTVKHNGKPVTKVRVDFENDSQGSNIAAKAASPEIINPPGFDSHMELALNLMLDLFDRYERASADSDQVTYCDLFDQGDLTVDL